MSKLVLFNLMVLLCTVYGSCANVSVAPYSNAGQTFGESVKRETITESDERTTIKESTITETTDTELSTETTTSETSTESGQKKTTTVSSLRKTASKPGLNEKATKFGRREIITESDQRETVTKSVLRETTTEYSLRVTSTESEMRETIKDMMETFCPLVDICDANSTNADLKSNGVVSRGRVSCCRGCSCHPDCRERMNCCYPEDYGSTDDTEKASSPYQCLYTRLGQDQHIDGTVPAYRTIVAPPVTGCVDSRPLRVTSDVLLNPTCDDINVTPLGPYFPVYSKETGDIYKNVLCARCHGAKKIEAFQSILVCGEDARKNRKSISEILGFLESKTLPPTCHVNFKHTNPNDLDGRRCYKDLIETCTAKSKTNLLKRLEEDPINLDFVTIEDLCENGLVAPTLEDKTFYKNIFCSMCAQASIDRIPLLCVDSDLDRTADDSFTFFIDSKIMHTIEKIHKQKKHREACVTHRGTKDDVCRIIHCPSGKILNGSGECVLVGKFIDTGRLLVLINLTPKENTDFNEPVNDQETQLFVKGILENNPWPNNWRVTIIRKRIDQTKCHEKSIAVVHLMSEEKETEALLQDIDTFTRLTWALDWKNKTYRLTQSFLDYEIKNLIIRKKSMYIPSWQVYYRKKNLTSTYLGCGPIEWIYVFTDLRSIGGRFVINRLYFCNQIDLMPEEFTLGPDKAYLESNLTKRILFDMEFDLIEDEDGLHARACLENTIFFTTEANGGSVLVRSVVILLVPLFLCCSSHL